MNKEILKRYFNGKSSLWEKKQVLEYFEGNDMQVFDEYLREHEADTAAIPDVNDTYKDDFYKELTAHINKIESPGKVQRNKFYRPFLRIAASLLMVASVGGALYFKFKPQSEAVNFMLTSVKNSSKNLKRVDMKDGTRIWLNPGTTLTFNPKEFGDTVRRVSITGEAYFNVAHDKRRPFRVNAGGITTTVLGTTFNVEAYPDETDVRVMLVTGQVRINTANATNILAPGQLLEYSRNYATMKVSSVNVADKQQLLTSGKLVFESVPLKDVVKRLERVFSVKISASGSRILQNKQITGSYFRDSADTALNRILFIHGLHYHKEGENKYVITN